MRALITFVVLGLTLVAAAPGHVGRVIGGSNTTIEAYPYVANLQYSIFGTYWTQFCGGSIITTFSILTAAHCVAGEDIRRWRARLGTSERSSGGTLHSVARFSVHPDYDKATALDANIGIVHLGTRAVLSATIQTVPIASPQTILFAGLPVTAIGWGYSYYEESGPTHPEQLQDVNINIVDQNVCAERYAFLKTQPGVADAFPDVTPGMVCAGILDVGTKGSCDFDDGGPVVHKGDIHIVIGVISHNYECGHSEYPDVLARVPYYTNWIVANAS